MAFDVKTNLSLYDRFIQLYEKEIRIEKSLAEANARPVDPAYLYMLRMKLFKTINKREKLLANK
jgi:hypothetical protein